MYLIVNLFLQKYILTKCYANVKKVLLFFFHSDGF